MFIDLLEARGLKIVRRTADNGPNISVLSLAIEHCILSEGKGAILQVGSNDGIMADPVREIILAYKLPAILVEPIPDIFEQLRLNYSDKSNIRFENVAVSTESGEAEIFQITPEAKHLPKWVHALASFDKSTLLKHNDNLGIRGGTLNSSSSPFVYRWSRLISCF